MFNEVITQEGIINSVENGKAEILVHSGSQCDICSAKIICRCDESGNRYLLIDNLFGGEKGDRVRISVKGKSILEATFLLYGFPIFLILIGVIFGMKIFNNELYASLSGLILAGLFFVFVFKFYKNKKNKDIIRTEIIAKSGKT